MMVKPSVTELLKKVNNRYELVVTTAKRARQLSKGETALTDKKEASTVTLAADEIAEGKISVVKDDKIQEEAVQNVESDVSEDIVG